MAKELGCHVDELPVYYGGDLWNPDGSDFDYSDYYDDQSELSDYEDPRDFFRDEWLDSCEFHAPNGSYFSVSEVGQASFPVSGYTAGTDVEVSVTPVKLQQDSWDASFSTVVIASSPVVDFFGPPLPLLSGPVELRNQICQAYHGPVMDFLGPPCCRGPTDVREYPGVSYESSSSMVVACTIATNMGAPETMVLEAAKEARFEGMCLWSQVETVRSWPVQPNLT